MASDLFSAETVSVSWVMNRLKVSRVTVLQFCNDGTLKAYRLKKKGWWRVLRSSVNDFERNIRNASGL